MIYIFFKSNCIIVPPLITSWGDAITFGEENMVAKSNYQLGCGQVTREGKQNLQYWKVLYSSGISIYICMHY